MKISTSNIIFILRLIVFALIMSLSLLHNSYAYEIVNVRDALVDSINTNEVIPIDDHYTLVIPLNDGLDGNTNAGLYDNLSEICSQNKGKIQRQTFLLNKNTGNITSQWKEVEENKQILQYLTKYRCKGVFEITNIYKAYENGQRRDNNISKIKAIVIKHNKPQHFVYKSRYIPPENKVVPLSNGSIYQTAKYIIKPGDGSDSFSKNAVISDINIFQYANTLCYKSGGQGTLINNKFVIIKYAGEDRWYYSLEEVTPIALVDYIEKQQYLYFNGVDKDNGTSLFSNGSTPQGHGVEWYYYCSGKSLTFTVHVSEEFKNGQSQKKALFERNINLDGIQYTKFDGTLSHAKSNK